MKLRVATLPLKNQNEGRIAQPFHNFEPIVNESTKEVVIIIIIIIIGS